MILLVKETGLYSEISCCDFLSSYNAYLSVILINLYGDVKN